jgi:hypothetical protein
MNLDVDDTLSGDEFAGLPTAAAPIINELAWSTEPTGVPKRTPDEHVTWGETFLVVWFAAAVTLADICYILWRANS